MATFKVGDRVKKVANSHPDDDLPISIVRVPIGAEGTIMGPGRVDDSWLVRFDRYASEHSTGMFTERSYKLAPLLHPDSAEWAADKVRDLFKPTYLEPERVKERA